MRTMRIAVFVIVAEKNVANQCSLKLFQKSQNKTNWSGSKEEVFTKSKEHHLRVRVRTKEMKVQ